MSSETITYNWALPCPRTPVGSCPPITIEYMDAHLGRATLVLVTEADVPAPINSRLYCTLRFAFDPMRDDSSVEHAVDRVIECVMNAVTFFEGIIPEGPSGLRSNLLQIRLHHEQRSQGGGGGIGATSLPPLLIRATGSVTYPFARDPDRLHAQLARALESSTEEPLIRAYRAARNSADPVSEFLLLYAIIMLIYGDKQAALDDAIDPHKSSRSPTKRNKDGETPYTRVRNELAHPSDRRRALHECAAEAKTLLGRFREVVQQHITIHLGF